MMDLSHSESTVFDLVGRHQIHGGALIDPRFARHARCPRRSIGSSEREPMAGFARTGSAWETVRTTDVKCVLDDESRQLRCGPKKTCLGQGLKSGLGRPTRPRFTPITPGVLHALTRSQVTALQPHSPQHLLLCHVSPLSLTGAPTRWHHLPLLRDAFCFLRVSCLTVRRVRTFLTGVL